MKAARKLLVLLAGLILGMVIYRICQRIRWTAPPGDYDLAVSGISHVPAEVKAGDKVTFTYGVANLGKDGIPPGTYDVDFYVDGKRVSFDHRSSGLVPGADHGSTYSMAEGHHHWQPAKPGTYRYGLVLDEKNRLKESNEGNNLAEGTIEVKEQTATVEPP
jgi:subtilase family serine protease